MSGIFGVSPSRATHAFWGWNWGGRLGWVYRRLAPDPSQSGRWGEWLALLHLRRLGWDILARNWTVKQGEIDLVAIEEDTLVFVEVKMRTGSVRPEENFTPEKQARLERLSNQFRTRYEMSEMAYRTDLIAIESADFRSFQLRHWLL